MKYSDKHPPRKDLRFKEANTGSIYEITGISSNSILLTGGDNIKDHHYKLEWAIKYLNDKTWIELDKIEDYDIY